MSLKSALLEMKEALMNDQVGKSEANYIQDIETKYNLTDRSLVFYYNNLMMLKMSQIETNSANDAKKVNRKWTKAEIEFMFQYIKERQDEGALNITEILEETAQLLNRGYQSVNYKYYSLVKAKEKETQKQTAYHFTTISQNEVPVLTTEVIRDTPQAPQVSNVNIPQDGDLLDVLSGLISNVEKLPGINLNELLRSLYLLTNMALQNQDAANQIESTNSEKEALKQQLIREKQRNDELQMEVAKLAKEIAAFNKLGDAAKIQNLKSYNQRLNYIIDSSGLVLKVGS